jgi:FMN phosphatase YigB (HAD superfamily)
MKYDAMIFDVDNVLIDTRKSFPVVIRTAIQWLWKRHLKLETDCTAFTTEHFRLMKSYPYFNDDFDIVWILVNIAASSQRKSLSESFPGVTDLQGTLDNFKGGDIEQWIRHGYGIKVPRNLVRKLCSEIYYGDEVFLKATGKPPSLVKCRGLWRFERPYLGLSWHNLVLPAGIYTGRYKYELELALKILGWEDFPSELAVTAEEGIKKPSPKGLEIICKRLNSSKPLYFGDAGSDRESMEKLGYGTFIAIGDVLKDAPIKFPDVQTALESLSLIEGASM